MITKERARELFNYDIDTGLFTRLVTVARRVKSRKGQVLDGAQSNGYLRVMIDGESVLLHRLVFVYLGLELHGQVDHIDGNRKNNAKANLRLVTHQENGKNVKLPSNNKSGVIGVCWDTRNSRWYAQIKHEGSNIFLGRHDSLEAAIKVRAQAEIKYGFHKNHGKR